jgi:radical SAM superfamily enzyme YgiQ (UPF0313 family)
MKVCFVDPKGIHFGLNTGIAYIVSYLKGVGGLEGARVFDFNNNSRDMDSRINEIARHDVIGFSIKSFTRDSALEIAYRVKRDSNVLITGGPHITLDGENFLKEHRVFDYGLCGEGEITTLSLLKALDSSECPEGIRGVIYRKGGEVITTGAGERIRDLDSVPYPDYSVFDSVADGNIHNYPLVTSRGCPYLCSYCCVKGVMGRKWFARSVENIIGELNNARDTYNINCFNVQDDNLTLDMDRARVFCEALIKNGLSFRWSCPNGIRADRVDDELMGKMHEAGCFAVALGIESGVEKEFEAIKKGEDLSDIVRAAELAKKNKIWVFGNFIIGLPNSNLRSIRESINFAKRLKLESCIFNLLVPFPGTEVWEWVKKNGRLLMGWQDGFTQGKNPKVVFETEDFPVEDRLRAYREANIKCKNYFAFMDEQDSLASNLLSVLGAIIRYDFWGIPGHILWCAKHSGRILARVFKKNA